MLQQEGRLSVLLAHLVDEDGEDLKVVDLGVVLQNGVVRLLVASLADHCRVHHYQNEQGEDGAFAAAKAGPGVVVEPG